MQFDPVRIEFIIEVLCLVVLYFLDYIYSSGIANRILKSRKSNIITVRVITDLNIEELSEIKVDSKKRMSNINILYEKEKPFANFLDDGYVTEPEN